MRRGLIFATILFVCWWLFSRQHRGWNEQRICDDARALGTRDNFARQACRVVWASIPRFIREACPLLCPWNSWDLEQVHWAAANDLAWLAPESPVAVQALTAAVHDSSLMQAQAALNALARIGPFASSAVGPLLALEKETNSTPDLCAAVYETLCEIAPGDSRVISAFLDRVDSSEPHSEVLALMQRAAPLYDHAVQTRLLGIWDSEKDTSQMLAAVICRIDPQSESTKAFLLSCLRNPDITVRATAARVVADFQMSEPIFLAEIRNALLDSIDNSEKASPFILVDRKNRSHFSSNGLLSLVDAIGDLGEAASETIPLIEHVTRADEPSICLVASFAFWKITGEDTTVRTTLTNLWGSNNSFWTRTLVLNSLQDFSEWPGATEFWKLALNDGDKKVRYDALTRICRFPHQAHEVIPELRELLHDRSAMIREAAAQALAHAH